MVESGGDSGDPVGGYSIFEADSPDALAKLLEDHPHRTMGGTIETLAVLSMPGT